MAEAPTITQGVAAFIVDNDFSRLAQPVVVVAKEHILDGLAVMLAGATTPPAAIAREYVQRTALSGRINVLASAVATTAPAAALANGVAGHAMDFDDTQLSSSPDRVYGL
ncbi:MAG: MmgE/PrpD family protein, partial [Dehalococcoidia bacterium]